MAKRILTIPIALAAVALAAGCTSSQETKKTSAKDAVPEYVGVPATLPPQSADSAQTGTPDQAAAAGSPTTDAPKGKAPAAKEDKAGTARQTEAGRDRPSSTNKPVPTMGDGGDDVKLVSCSSVGGVAFAKVSIKNSGSKSANYLVQGTATSKQAKPASTKSTAKSTSIQLVGGTVVKPGESATVNLAGGGAPAAVACRIDKVSRF